MQKNSNVKKFLNYIFWLQERGLTTFILREDSQIGANLPLQQQKSTLEIGSSLNAAPRLAILCDPLEPQEELMLQRIIQALNLRMVDVKIHTTTKINPKFYEEHIQGAACVLVLGPLGAKLLSGFDSTLTCLNVISKNETTNQSVLLIAHPKAMLSESQLKIKAWEGLRNLREILKESAPT